MHSKNLEFIQQAYALAEVLLDTPEKYFDFLSLIHEDYNFSSTKESFQNLVDCDLSDTLTYLYKEIHESVQKASTGYNFPHVGNISLWLTCHAATIYKELEELEELNLEEIGYLDTLPHNITNFKNLKVFHSPSSIEMFPSNFENLSCLETLVLKHSNIKQLPKMGPTVTTIEMSYTKIEEIACFPPFLRKLTCTNWDKFHEEICQATTLEELEVETRMEHLPVHFTQLTNLKSLSIRGGNSNSSTGLLQLPSTIHLLSKLEYLSLHANKLEKLPESFGQLTSLKYLSLYRNEFRIFPVEICTLTSLTELNLASNKLEIIPKELSSLRLLEKLDVFSNQITDLTKSLSQLSCLKELDLSHNYITRFPSEVLKLKKLEKLSIGHNPMRFEELPNCVIGW